MSAILSVLSDGRFLLSPVSLIYQEYCETAGCCSVPFYDYYIKRVVKRLAVAQSGLCLLY